MCSPTRASLLTGMDAHRAGIGHVAHSDAGYPGYAMELADNVVTMAETLRDAGWSTMMVGKWHLCKDSDNHAAGDKNSWPLQRGFEQFHGILDGFTNFHQPHRLFEGNSVVAVDSYPDDYYFTDAITDRAIQMISDSVQNDPTKPFMMYLSHGAVHAPLHAKPADIAAHEGRYAAGWDAIRSERMRRLKDLGVVADDAVLPPRNHEGDHGVLAWDELSDDERTVFARYMEIYAAMVVTLDESTARVRAALEDLGVLDDTIILFTSDNGASREGATAGTSSYLETLLSEPDVARDLARLDEMGGPTTFPHYPQGWAMACNTPFRLYKTTAHAGGHQVPMIWHWPNGPSEVGGIRRQYTHVTDVFPTILDLVGIERPSQRHGIEVQDIGGSSFADALSDPAAPEHHTEQMTEIQGNRGFFRDGWEIVALHTPWTPFDDSEFELFDLTADPTESNNLAATHPEKVTELADAWDEAAWAGQVYPLDDGSMVKYTQRPPWNDRFAEPITLRPGGDTLDRYRSLQLIFLRETRITIDLDWQPGQHGVLVAHGDQGGGYVVWVDGAGTVTYAHNAGGKMWRTTVGPLAPGAQQIIVHLDIHDEAMHWSVALSTGDLVSAIPQVPMIYGMAPFQGIDIGIDRRSPVDWNGGYTPPAPYTGTLRSVRYEPGAHPSTGPLAMVELLRAEAAKFD